MNNQPLKCCSKKDKCLSPMGCWQPATLEHFTKHNQTKDGFRPYCKCCQRAYQKTYYDANRVEIIKKVSTHHKEHPEQTRERNRRFEAKNKDKRKAQKKANHIANPQQQKIRSKRYRENNYEKVLQRERDYKKNNRTEINKRARDRRKNSPSRIIWERDYRQNNPHSHKAIDQRRLARKRGLPDTFTQDDWDKAFNYFHGCCAVCGRQLNSLLNSHRAAADHWIPLASDNCPGTIPTNIVPLCHGMGGCNNRKSNRNPFEFLETEFGKHKSKKILARIEKFFEWIQSQS